MKPSIPCFSYGNEISMAPGRRGLEVTEPCSFGDLSGHNRVRENGSDGGSDSRGALDLEDALQFTNALAHAGYSNSGGLRQIGISRPREAAALVLYLKPDVAVGAGKLYLRGAATGIAMHVRQSLLDEPEQGGLDFLMEASELLGNTQRDLNFAAF